MTENVRQDDESLLLLKCVKSNHLYQNLESLWQKWETCLWVSVTLENVWTEVTGFAWNPLLYLPVITAKCFSFLFQNIFTLTSTEGWWRKFHNLHIVSGMKLVWSLVFSKCFDVHWMKRWYLGNTSKIVTGSMWESFIYMNWTGTGHCLIDSIFA